MSEPEALEERHRREEHGPVKYIPVKQSFVSRYALDVSSADVDAWPKEPTTATFVDTTVNNRKADFLPKAGHIRHILVKVSAHRQRRRESPRARQARARGAAHQRRRRLRRRRQGLSDDTGSAAKGGDAGDKTTGSAAVQEGGRTLKPGETTNAAIETRFGYHYIKKDDPSKSAEVEAAMKRDNARELYVKTKSLDGAKDPSRRRSPPRSRAVRRRKTRSPPAIKPLVKPGAPLAALPIVSEPPPAPAASADAARPRRTRRRPSPRRRSSPRPPPRSTTLTAPR